MNESEFHRLSDAWLNTAQDVLETADREGVLDVELSEGSLNVILSSGKHFVISKHSPSKQLWLSSPISGGLHFPYDGEWKLADGRTLGNILAEELKSLGGIEVTF